MAHRQLRGKSFCRRAGIQQCGDNLRGNICAGASCRRIMHARRHSAISQNQRTCCARPAIGLPAAAVEAATARPVSAERAALAAASNSCARCMMAPHSQSMGARDCETAATSLPMQNCRGLISGGYRRERIATASSLQFRANAKLFSGPAVRRCERRPQSENATSVLRSEAHWQEPLQVLESVTCMKHGQDLAGGIRRALFSPARLFRNTSDTHNKLPTRTLSSYAEVDFQFLA